MVIMKKINLHLFKCPHDENTGGEQFVLLPEHAKGAEGKLRGQV